VAEGLANAATTTLASGISSGATSLTVASASAFPATAPFRILLVAESANTNEIMTVTAGGGTTTWTVSRASEPYNGTQSASAHSSGATVKQVLTKQGLINAITDNASGALDASGLTTQTSLQGLSDYVVGYDTSASATRGFPVGRIRIGRQHTVIADDCFFVATGTVHEGGVTQQVTGTGAATSIGTAVAGRVGVIQIASGTTTTGRCSLASNQVTVLGGGKVRFGTVFQLSDLSDGTNTFTWRLGLIDNGGSAPSDAVMFRYTHSVNSGKWEGVCVASSTETAIDTGISADTSWHTFEFEVNAAATSVQFYIDGVATGSAVTTNIPTTNVLCHVPAFVRRSAGTGLLTGQGLIDAYWYIYEFTAAR
jgi:hypothetical protein